jgi:hypothetical protein
MCIHRLLECTLPCCCSQDTLPTLVYRLSSKVVVQICTINNTEVVDRIALEAYDQIQYGQSQHGRDAFLNTNHENGVFQSPYIKRDSHGYQTCLLCNQRILMDFDMYDHFSSDEHTKKVEELLVGPRE